MALWFLTVTEFHTIPVTIRFFSAFRPSDLVRALAPKSSERLWLNRYSKCTIFALLGISADPLV